MEYTFCVRWNWRKINFVLLWMWAKSVSLTSEQAKKKKPIKEDINISFFYFFVVLINSQSSQFRQTFDYVQYKEREKKVECCSQCPIVHSQINCSLCCVKKGKRETQELRCFTWSFVSLAANSQFCAVQSLKAPQIDECI